MAMIARVSLAAAVAGLVQVSGAVRGVEPSKLSLYPADIPFKCHDGEKTIAFSEVNDNYCDCADGSDEPGTSACKKATFYCANEQAEATILPSYRVNDGICDCCDGSDEYDGPNVCKDTCEEAGRAQREARAEAARVAKAGFALRKEFAQAGVALRASKAKELADAKQAAASLEAELATLQAAKTAAEEPEQAKKKAFDDEWDETLKAREEAVVVNLWVKLGGGPGQEGTLSTEKLNSHMEFDSDEDGAVSQEEAEDVLDIDGDGALNETEVDLTFDMFKKDVFDSIKEKFDNTEPDRNKPEYTDEIKALIEAATAARTAYDEVNNKKRDLDQKVADTEKALNQDWGTDSSFAYMLGECFEAEVSEYKYKVCPFDTAKQEKKTGGGGTSLGTFKGFTGKVNKYSEMKFEGGQKCWNGPNRSMKVTLKCGVDTKLSTVIEPSMCEYESIMTSPALCDEPAAEHDEL